MKAPSLRFKPRPADAWLGHASGPAWRWAAWLVLPLAAAVLGWAGLRAWSAQQDLQAWSASREAARQADRRSAQQAEPAPAAAVGLLAGGLSGGLSAARTKALNGVIDRLNLAWLPVLDAVAAETLAPVTLLWLAADGERGLLRIEAEAPTLPALLAYAQRLRAARLFEQVLLVRHETIEREARRPTRLTLELVLAQTQTAPRDNPGAR